MPTQDLIDRHSATYPKALGVAWDSTLDTMATHIDLPPEVVSTKRGIISYVAKTFDVLGWLAPTILTMKVLYQQLWEEQLGWDDQVPEHYQLKHSTWRSQLPILSTIKLPRCYYESEPALSIELHGFSDASEAAYAAVVYVRVTYKNHAPTYRIVMAKTKVAPIKSLSIPRLELCGAALLSKVLTTVRHTLNIPIEDVHAWSDGSIVLAWLDGAPKRYKTYVGNRIASITDLVPPSAAHSQKHPIIVSSKDSIIELLLKYNHVCLGHCGPTLLMSYAGERFHIIGARRLACSICSHCITCKKVSAWVETQRMGQLPAACTTPSPPFSVTSINCAGPFTLKRGHTRKPVLVKAYIALFVCFLTKAVHIEIVSDLTTEAFLAALKRFVSRCGLPSAIHSNNGTNFVGARNDLNELYRFLSSATTSSAIDYYLLTNRISWHCIPERAPHFGGLWEAAVKSTKYHLRRAIGAQRLDFEEFSTITAQEEACLNSRPLCSTTSHSPDGIMLLTPGHFLIGRSL